MSSPGHLFRNDVVHPHDDIKTCIVKHILKSYIEQGILPLDIPDTPERTAVN